MYCIHMHKCTDCCSFIQCCHQYFTSVFQEKLAAAFANHVWFIPAIAKNVVTSPEEFVYCVTDTVWI